MSKTSIHPTAIIEDGAQIGAGVQIGPYCIIGPQVSLGDNVHLHAHVVLGGRTKIGAGTVIYPFASIGMAPQDLKYNGEDSELIIGERNVIREHVTMNPGTRSGTMKTVVGNDNLFMVASHIAHDCIIGNHVILANNATLGGHVEVGDYAIIGGLAAIHQFIRIGEHAIIGGMSGVESDVIPYGRVKGERAHLAGLNLIGLERRGFARDELKGLQHAYYLIFAEEGTLEERLQKVSADYKDDVTVMNIIDFIKAKTRFPICQPIKKAA